MVNQHDRNHEHARETMTPTVLSRYLGQKHAPTDQQAAIIGAEPGPLLVVAGAGAGKTETMAARVVWLVANGFAAPDEVLGLTFTRKAARELGKRIRDRLTVLAENTELVRRLDPTGKLADSLTVIAPHVSTYDAYAGELVKEYGLLVPAEPDSRIITDAELYSIAHDVVTSYSGNLLPEGGRNYDIDSIVADLLGLVGSLGNELVEPAMVREHAADFLKETEDLPKGPRSKTKGEFTTTMAGWRARQVQRVEFLDLVEELVAELRRRGVVTFNEQMSVAAKLVRSHPTVGESQRRRYRVVMLDEYQDTSHAQRVLLRSLYGEGRTESDPFAHPLTVTAVGDPMQAIYGWRGATSANLAAFVEDFPLPGGGNAPKMQLTTSWRNPADVLTLANTVSDALLGTGDDRAVAPLKPRDGAGEGDVTLGYFETRQEEIDFVADRMAQAHAKSQETSSALSAAVLVRANAASAGIAEALEKRGVPYEISGLAGLLDVPEVADTVAVASMLVRPHDSASALRVLAGPAVGLGLADLDALARRVANLQGAHRTDDAEPVAEATDPETRLREQLAKMIEEAENITAAGDRPAGLADAVADLGETDRYSDEGLARLKDLASKLRSLRTGSLGKRLPDVFADIISTFGIRTEVLARRTAAGTVHLDRLLDEVAKFPGTSVEALLDYFALARKHEDGLTPGDVPMRTDRVQILTAHKAKGLEWDTVALLHADEKTFSADAESFLSKLKLLPDDEFAAPDAENRTEFESAAKEYIAQRKAKLNEELARLFYVAITRTERALIVTGSLLKPGTKTQRAPYEHFTAIRDRVADDRVASWALSAAEPENGDYAVPPREGVWPHYAASAADLDAANLVRDAITHTPEAAEGELFHLWERDTTALIDEHAALSSAEVPVVIPGELTASDIVALKADPAQFARRARRPVPFKPNTYAKRGTAFHEWVEEFYGARPLLSEDDLPGSDESDVDKRVLEQLQANFEASRWAQLTPAFVEHPFELALGESVVRGRMDAVFEDGDDWVVVDWKTGSKPGAGDMESVKLQLAVYAEAWRRIAGDGRNVRAVFFYVRTGEDYSPADLPGHDELAQLLRDSSREGLKFVGSSEQ
ncbi:ATP-dependent helicase [Corynebacterium sp.]|uniref:ATP-dependent helicase n=1 Tax=Corynebacterium sp. TaxID=1720 RepID=UPI002A909A69|nr:UvrD-helicase domain-containing protein [Corynebacterium sp.]MDY5786364.1 UvrD-helicase domain-containing protein [Corynebacterium sp.]